MRKLKNFIQTSQGNLFDYDNIESNKLDIRDVAHSLSQQCRWSGHTKFPYSVGQHSVYAAIVAKRKGYTPQLQFEALMHDCPETWVVDLPRPLKRLCADYEFINGRVERHCAKEFGYPAAMSPEVREIDDGLLVTEYHQLIDINDEKRYLETSIPNFNMPKNPFDIIITYTDPTFIYIHFLQKYHDLKKQIT